jgi:exodeoxyribonuclease III
MARALFKISTLNCNGIRSAAKKGLLEWAKRTSPDVLCVQELKAHTVDLHPELVQIAGMQGYHHCAQKKGYSGVGIYTRHRPSKVLFGFDKHEFDTEGRYVELRFDTPVRKFSVISCYFPSGSSGEERQLAKYRFLDKIYPHLVALRKKREFVLCGDVNIAHQKADLKNFKGNAKNSGFLPEERAWLSRLFGDARLVDVYRRLKPDTTDACYTWWSQRGQAYAKNVGWRLDYHMATPAFAELARDEEIYKTEKFSDHAPVTIRYAFKL